MVKITENIYNVGVNDYKLDMFEGQYPVPNGMAYNSYVILDEEIAVFDTVDADFTDEWLANIADVLNGKSPSYLVVLHMEPDHSANIMNFVKAYPEAKIVANAKAFNMMKLFLGTDFADNRIVVENNGTLSLGTHTLNFVFAPMVHWPEVMVCYENTEKVLFSADAFGKFGAYDADEDWTDEARRYYIGIVGKYGVQVQALLKKVSTFDIATICSLHGPALTENLTKYLDLYEKWSTYTAEEDGIVIAYTSVYGNTKEAVLMLAKELEEKNCKVTVYDLARCDMSKAVADAFRFSKLVLATTTYNGTIFPFMKEYIDHLTERNYSKRTVGIIENGSWASMAGKVINKMLEGSKEINFTENNVKIASAVSSQNEAEIKLLASELAK